MKERLIYDGRPSANDEHADIQGSMKGLKPVPAEIEGGGHTWWYVCGECHTAIDRKDKYCRECGRRMKWE